MLRTAEDEGKDPPVLHIGVKGRHGESSTWLCQVGRIIIRSRGSDMQKLD